MRLKAKALLFDNDGVLVDSHAAVHAAWATLSHEFGLEGFDIADHYGTRAQDLALRYVGPERFEAANNRINQLEQETAHETLALAGAKDLLESLPEGRWTICTSANPNLGRARIEAAGLPVPASLVTSADVERGKPAPDPYLLGAERLGYEPADCIVFEDAQAGVDSAMAAGIGFVIGVSRNALTTQADLVIESLVGISFNGEELVIPDSIILRR